MWRDITLFRFPNAKILIFVIINKVLLRLGYVMRLRFSWLAMLLMLALTKVSAQYDVHFTHYWAMDNFYNPAAMNKNNQLNLVASYSMQMAGYEHRPSTMYVGANSYMPWGQGRQSAGAGFLNETIGLFTHRRIFANYAYKLKVGGGWMNVGAQVGLLNEEFDGGGLDVIDANDPAFPTSAEKGTGLDLGAGVYYNYKIFYAGLSAQHITSPVITYGKGGGKGAELRVLPAFYFQSGCNIQLRNPLLSIQPTVQAATDLGTLRVDITLRGTYQYQSNSYYAGISYSPGTSVTILLGGRVKKVLVGYAYELFTNGIGWQTGSHDLVVEYQMDVDFFKKGKNVHKSVRYL